MKLFKTIFYLSFALLFLLVTGSFDLSYAGGPLFVASNGNPVIWAKREIKSGALSSTTVNAQGQVLYRVDSGPLGPLSNADAVKLVDRIFKLYTDIPTATIEFVNAGALKNPNTGVPIDVDRTNFGLVGSSRNPSFQNPIVFDSDASITGNGGVLGFFGFLAFARADIADPSSLALAEGIVVLNGRAISSIGKVPFIGVFTHEFGHFAGPLDHSQLNGSIASGSSFANIPAGYTGTQLFDVFAPYIETVYPFLFDGPREGKLGNSGLSSSGSFIASLAFDDILALSALYPAPGYLPSESGSQVGGIAGKVVIRTSTGDFPITGLNVVARRISLGKFPPDPTTDVFRGSIPTDPDGAPLPPPARPELDSLATAASFVSGVLGGNGAYQFIGLPPGDYLISVEKINPNFLGGSSVGPRDEQLELLEPESFNGASESNTGDNPRDFVPVKVTAGAITQNINIVLNGFGLSPITNLTEVEPNDTKKDGQKISVDTKITGSIRGSDPAKISIDFGQGFMLPVQDLYRVTVKSPTQLYISLEADKTSSDIDVLLFAKNIKNGAISANSSLILNGSLGLTGSELIGTGSLAPGTYIIGVSSGQDNANYTLSVFAKK